MLVDARAMADVDTIECEVCVIGGGAAGITIAREFAGHEARICVLESGGEELDVDSQELYEGENIGLPYHPLSIARLRFLGGTTNHWTGQYLHFTEADFETQSWLPFTGWPIGLSDVMPYYERATAMIGLPDAGWDVEHWAAAFERTKLEFEPERFGTRVFLVKPLHMARVYRDDLEAANVQVCLFANAVDLETNESATEVRRVRVRTLEGNGFTVVARHVVAAAGGIENPRLLLSANSVQKPGLGNGRDLVGRFFLEHPFFNGGVIQPRSPAVPAWFYYENNRPDVSVRPYLLLSDELQRQEELVATGVSLIPMAEPAYGARGTRSLRHIAREAVQAKVPSDLTRHVGNVAADLGSIADVTYQWLRYGQVPIDRINCRVALTPVPNLDSRVTLGDERDALGMRRVRLDWRLSEVDKRSARRTMEILGAEVGRLGLGRLRTLIDDDDSAWPDDLEGAFHHVGTTRMADDPSQGVVDRDCRVHGISNLFVAGSSVFPTVGAGTPTFLIISLAIRLSDHLKKLL